MSEEKDAISPEELEALDGELLPDREEMAVISDPLFGGFSLPVEPPVTE